jgi:hypothetical protein
MEENPLLLRLKELERLIEKAGRIDLHARDGPGHDALLARLVRLKAPDVRDEGCAKRAKGRSRASPSLWRVPSSDWKGSKMISLRR